MKQKLFVSGVFSGFSLALLLLYGFMANLPAQTGGPDEARIKHGEYLVNLGGCNDCHSPKVMTRMGPVPDESRLLSGHPANEKLPRVDMAIIGPEKWGGQFSNDLTAWAGPWGVSFAANLTPDKNTGLGLWTTEIFIKTMRTGKHMGAGRPILPPMPWQSIGKVSDSDLRDIFVYLQSLKPIQNAVPVPLSPNDLKTGMN